MTSNKNRLSSAPVRKQIVRIQSKQCHSIAYMQQKYGVAI